MKRILYFLLTSLLIISLVFAFTACKDNGDTPGGDVGDTPGGDVGNTPGGDSGNTPGGDSGNTPGGDVGDNPNNEHTHSYTEKVANKEYIANAATCTEPASYYYSCECGEIMDDGETFTHGEPLGHDMIEMDGGTTPPTCTEDGSFKVVCSRCGITETTTITATGHTFFEGSCVNCGTADPDYVPVCEHEWVDPTCTADGYCSICKEPGEKATGHKYTDGVCGVCGEADPDYVPVCKHEWVDPTCTEDGYCSICKEAGDKATGHKYNAEVTVPTCTEDGYTTYTCSVCSDTYSSDYVGAIGHKYTDGVCGVCGEADPDYKPECEHKWVAPTCSEDGYCALCNEKGDKATGIHDYVDGFCAVCNALNPDYVPEVSEGFRFELSEDKTYYILIDVDACDDKYIVIPGEYEGLPVKAIRESAFSHCHTFIHVEIPDSITSIGDFAFAYCNGLTSITIPDSVTYLGEGAFRNCPNLKNVIGGNSITSIGNHTFTDCQNLESITIGNSVTSIGDYAFYDCESLTSIRIPMSVTSIGECPFYYCSSITIYCDAESQPEGWSYNWNYENYPVIWGCHEHTYVDGKCTGCGEADPDYYVVMSITEALAAPDGTNVIVTGTVCTINALWNGKTNHVTITDNAGNTLYIYGLINEVKLGDIIKVTGTLTTYNGIKETTSGCTAEIVGYDDSYGYKEVTIKEATELPDNTNVIITGTVVLINTPYDGEYNNMSVTVRDDEGNELFIYRLQGEVSVHDVITITGAMGTHSGVRQLTGGAYEYLYTADCTFTGDGTCQSPKICYCGKVLEGADHVFDDSGRCTVCGFPTPGIHITIAEAIALGEKCGHNIFTEGMYYVTGVITEIVNFTYGNMYITDGKDTLYIYGVYSQDGIRFDALENQPAVGDTITLYGILGKYNTSIQMKNAAIIESGSDEEHSHVWIENERFESTCTTQGYIDYYCTGCDDNYKVALPLADHNYVDGKCTVCGEPDPEYAPEECKHEYVVKITEPTCITEGEKYCLCTLCGESYTEYLGYGEHQFVDGYCIICKAEDPEYAPEECKHEYVVKITEPTCITEGEKYCYCTLCGESYTEYFGYGDHQFDDAGYCTVCGENFGTGEGGDPDYCTHDNRTEATCTEDSVCHDCGTILVNRFGHQFVDGYCIVCKAEDPDYVPEECKHTYIETGRYDGSCSDNGYVNFVCTECGKTYTETLPITEPHNYEETSVPPTCSDRGYIKYTCIACSYTYYDYIPALDHQWTYPTCEDYECCSVCGVMSGNPPRGHVYEGVNCKYCGYTCTDHELELISSLAPTCNTTGNDIYGCKECEYKEPKFHLALGHTWLDGYCSVCGTEKQSEGFVFTFESIGEYWKITGIGSCADTNVIIPDVYEGYPVKHIAKLTRGQMESIVIPDSIVLLDTDAFRFCSKLTEIVIPKNVVYINPACFEGCSSLERIIVADENSYFKSVDGVLYTKDGSTLLFYPGARKYDTLVIPEGLTNIEENAFSQAQYLKYVTIPEGYVKNSDARPFYNCTSIEQVILPSTTEEIYGAMFQGCSNLKWINLPEGLTTIHTSAFEGCSSLTEIIMPDSVAGMGSMAFYKCTSLESVKLSEGLTVIQDDCFYKCVSLTTVIIPDSVTKIEANAFQDCPKLDTFVIGNGIKSIQGYAFKNTYISNVYYNGTAEQWEEILPNIAYPNDELTSQTIHFFSESKPTTEGNFWHYVDGVPTLW